MLNKSSKIGFVVKNHAPYNQVMASTRLRCYDVINFLKENKYFAEMYNPQQHYDVVVFQKCFWPEHQNLAAKLNQQNKITILDINANLVEWKGGYFDFINEERQKSVQKNIEKMLNIVDYVLVSSQKLEEIYSHHHSSVFCIEEAVTDNFFKVKKKHSNKENLKLLYCGYSVKVEELLEIKDVLLQLHENFCIKLLYITDKDPEMNIIPYQFIQYNQEKLPFLLLEGDIKIAPRKLDNLYNLGHSYTKVAYPMSVGIPAVASPVFSYLNRGVFICHTEEEWYKTLTKLIQSSDLRQYYGERSQAFVKRNFSQDKIANDYITFFRMVLGRK